MPPPCLACDSHSPDTFAEESSEVTFDSGAVFRIIESIATPVEEVLSHSGLTGAARERSRTSLLSVTTKLHATSKSPRPCILLDTYSRAALSTNTVRPSICLMATFEGTRMVSLPRILQFFCIAVYPTIPLDDAYIQQKRLPKWADIHLHSFPEWPPTEKCNEDCTHPCTDWHYNQWVFAWSFHTSRPLLGRWLVSQDGVTCTGAGDRVGVAFGDQAMAILQHICDRRRRMWMKLCREDKSGAFAREHEKEYRKWFKEHEAKQELRRRSSPSKTSSLISTPCRTHARSIFAETLFNQTIHENSESEVASVNMYKAHGPEIPVSKGKTATAIKQLQKKHSRSSGYSGRDVSRSPYPSAAQRVILPSTKSDASSRKSTAGSSMSSRPNKLLNNVRHRLSILKLQ
ncbi:hypothetical protein PYCCODRAFT_1462350 [Trametes coccinea BRFM310]|uniref:Uncharacterized protein n=1 Tax=Trametes coccinea (strain BRFM310) TaxID=1353009 RepID=A0A1Y2I9Q0_TRAC3|nr:hypothetical protein PYCCODRAFT_1462350 [Trametes coccinea BRFM310]